MKELIICMAKALVDHPDKVAVFEVNGGHTSIFELKVAKEDLVKVIGKKGETAKAMRTIVSAASSKVRKKSFLEIIE
ncbi:MAG: KH domain-containing protein [Deltaproteobacteria bacterium]|nr:KH domain-containing protein [Deltaproteobacteria bacterium]